MRTDGIELDLDNEEAYVLMEILQTFNGRFNKEQQNVADYLADVINEKLFKEGNQGIDPFNSILEGSFYYEKKIEITCK